MKIKFHRNVPKECKPIAKQALGIITKDKKFYDVSTIVVRACNKKQRKTHFGFAELTSAKTGLIHVDFTQIEDVIFNTILHESYHIHQMAKGIIRCASEGFFYRGFFIPYSIYSIFHSFVPFEASAIHYAALVCEKLGKKIPQWD